MGGGGGSGGGGKGDYPLCYFTASLVAAIINFPLWKASAIGQSGFDKAVKGNTFWSKYMESLKPPYKGCVGVIGGMTWARAFIFYGSEKGKRIMRGAGVRSEGLCTLLPPIVTSTIVQLVNQPIIRASITVQNPETKYSGVLEATRAIHSARGLAGLWHGTSAGIMKTIPKYVVAVAVKDVMEERLDPPIEGDRLSSVIRSAKKSVTAGVAGAALTNPLDVLRNEMFKTDLSVVDSFNKLVREEGARFVIRGLYKNLVAVALPVACTIFFTDGLVQMAEDRDWEKRERENRIQQSP